MLRPRDLATRILERRWIFIAMSYRAFSERLRCSGCPLRRFHSHRWSTSGQGKFALCGSKEANDPQILRGRGSERFGDEETRTPDPLHAKKRCGESPCEKAATTAALKPCCKRLFVQFGSRSFIPVQARSECEWRTNGGGTIFPLGYLRQRATTTKFGVRTYPA
jgi:hypothetical protein